MREAHTNGSSQAGAQQQPCDDLAAHKWLSLRYESDCKHCGADMQRGELVFPGSPATIPYVKGYLHATCALALSLAGKIDITPPICKHFLSKGYCLLGDACYYRHPPKEGLQAEAAEAAGVASQAKVTNASTRKENRGPGRRNKIRNSWKASFLRRWLLQAFGKEQLAAGSGVLDVAGGKGELAFELVNLSGVPATCVDPRPPQTDGFVKMLRRGLYHESVAFSDINTEAQPGPSEPHREPGSLRVLLTEEVINAVVEYKRLLEETPDTAAHDNFSITRGSASQTAACDAHSGPASTTAPTPPSFRQSACSRAPMPTQLPPGLSAAARAAVCQSLAAAREITWGEKGLVCAGAHEADGEEGGTGGTGSEAGGTGDGQAVRMTRREVMRQARLLASGAGQTAGPADSHQRDTSPVSCAATQPVTGVQAAAVAAAAPISRAAVQQAAPGARPISLQQGQPQGDSEGLQGAGVGVVPEGDVVAVLHCLATCSVVVGLHPDQATEYAVDLAVALGRPFAVVPCCVYSQEFQWRRRKDGTAVRTYDQFLAYLAEKCGGVRVDQLLFEGKNVLVWWPGPDR